MGRLVAVAALAAAFAGLPAGMAVAEEDGAELFELCVQCHGSVGQGNPLALARSLGHTCYHVGQIVQVARFHAGDKWNTLTIPRGGSQQFNQAHWGQAGRSHS